MLRSPETPPWRWWDARGGWKISAVGNPSDGVGLRGEVDSGLVRAVKHPGAELPCRPVGGNGSPEGLFRSGGGAFGGLL